MAGTSGRAESLLPGKGIWSQLRAIATLAQNDYSLVMRLRTLRRLFALCAVVALSLGVVAHGFAAADMDAKMAAAAAAGAMSPASCDCDGCGDHGMPTTGCFAHCGGTVAVLPGVAPLRTVTVERPAPSTVHVEPGRSGPPNPYPPRPSVLS